MNQLTYDDCVELRDAGFVFTEVVSSKAEFVGSLIASTGFTDGELIVFKDNKAVYNVPSLSGLIEACKPKTADEFYLQTELGEWKAFLAYFGYFEEWPNQARDERGFVAIQLDGKGSTPEQAVKNLWLALNPKK